MRPPLVWMALLAVACDAPGSPAGDDDGGLVGSSETSEPGAVAEPNSPRPVDPSAVIFDESIVRIYRLTVSAEDWAWLNQNALLEEYVPATVDIDGVGSAIASVRFKGNYGSLNRCFGPDGLPDGDCPKLPLKLSFNEVDADGKFHGLKKINLHAMLSDKSKMHDAIGYRLFREAGVAAPRTAFARVVVNGEALGLYAVVENIDGRFTRSRFADGGEGNLYKEVWPKFATAEPYLDALATNEDEAPSVDRMVRFAGDLTTAGDAGFRDTIAAWTDVEQLVGYFAVARLIDHWDDVITWYCSTPERCHNHNFYWYESTTEDRVTLIPWDLDHTFEEPSPMRTFWSVPDWDVVDDASCDLITTNGSVDVRPASCDPLLRRIVTQLWPEYRAASEQLVAGSFSPAAMAARVDELTALLEPHVAEDPFLVLATWHTRVADLREAIDAKRDYIAAKMGDTLPPPDR
jgi:spore coat protein H